jgi:hypothetical protein
MKFFKENSYDIVRLLINQLGITIFSLVLYTAAGFIEDEALNLKVRIILSVFATVFYFALLYTVCWDYGAKDKIRIDGGKYSATKFKGLIMSLISSIPTLILAFICVLSLIIYIAGGPEAFYTVFGIVNLLLRFISSMYLGMLQGVFSGLSYDMNLKFLWESVGYFVMPFIAALICHLGYFLGRRETKLLSVFFAKKK